MKKVLLVGCGNMGSRHLQGLVKSSTTLDIFIIEPNSESISIAKNRLNEIQNSKHHKINWNSTLNNCQHPYDLVIISTLTKGRAKLILKLLHNGNKRFLIEKPVCQSIYEYDELLSSFSSYNAKGWINISRRYSPVYQEIKTLINNSLSTIFSVNGGNYGLGTNLIHYLDLFCWISNNSTLSLDGSNLDENVFANKRGTDFIELNGIVSGKTKSNSIFLVNFIESNNSKLVLEISNGSNHFLIDEEHETIIDSSPILQSTSVLQLQSSLTTCIINEILDTDTCLLPELNDLYEMHKEMFRIFNEHISKITHKNNELCPIT